MYAGVLKNRLLTLTDGQFDEGDWGAATFTSLIESLPQLVRVDRGVRPPMVELLEPDELEAAPTEVIPSIPTRASEERATEAGHSSGSRRWRIRKDLWDAVLGVRGAFIWDGRMATRVPAEQAHDEERRLPTLTGPDLDAWQSEFAQAQAPDPAYAGILESWARGATPTAKLPRHLQHLWYARLKTLVRSRLESWFEGHHATSGHDRGTVDSPRTPRRYGVRVARARRCVRSGHDRSGVARHVPPARGRSQIATLSADCSRARTDSPGPRVSGDQGSCSRGASGGTASSDRLTEDISLSAGDSCRRMVPGPDRVPGASRRTRAVPTGPSSARARRELHPRICATRSKSRSGSAARGSRARHVRGAQGREQPGAKRGWTDRDSAALLDSYRPDVCGRGRSAVFAAARVRG